MSYDLSTAITLFQSRRARRAMPYGYWEDGNWFPSEAERRPCCDRIKPPGARQTLLEHCRTAAHIAELVGVERSAILRGVR